MRLQKKTSYYIVYLGFIFCLIFMLVSIEKHQSSRIGDILLNGLDPSTYIIDDNISTEPNIEVRTKMLLSHIDNQYETINKLHLTLKNMNADHIGYLRYEMLFWALISVVFLVLSRRINKL